MMNQEEIVMNQDEIMMGQGNILNKHIILKGEVVHGKALGRTVGMPTANLKVDAASLKKQGDVQTEQNANLLTEGVYATRIKVGEKYYRSVTNVGRRPSVDNEKYITVESFILDFHEEIYGEQVELEFVTYLRPVQKFDSLEEVSEQVKKDIERAKQYL